MSRIIGTLLLIISLGLLPMGYMFESVYRQKWYGGIGFGAIIVSGIISPLIFWITFMQDSTLP